MIVNIQSVITIEKEISYESTDENGLPTKLYLAYISVNINRDNGQCILNLQILDKNNYEKYNYYIYTQVREFMENLGAYSQGCMLELLCGILPTNEQTNEEAATYLKL